MGYKPYFCLLYLYDQNYLFYLPKCWCSISELLKLISVIMFSHILCRQWTLMWAKQGCSHVDTLNVQYAFISAADSLLRHSQSSLAKLSSHNSKIYEVFHKSMVSSRTRIWPCSQFLLNNFGGVLPLKGLLFIVLSVSNSSSQIEVLFQTASF